MALNENLIAMVDAQDLQYRTIAERDVRVETASESYVDFTSRYLYQVDVGKIEVPEQVAFEANIVDTTIRHVDAATTLLNRHLDLFNAARERLLDAADKDGAGARLLAFVEKWKDDPDVRALLDPYVTETLPTAAAAGGFRLRPKPALKISDLKVTPPPDAPADAYKDNDASALFKLSRHAMDDFHALGGQRDALERLKRRKTVQMKESARRSAQLERDIATARVEYANLDKTRLAAEEDYGLVRGLLEEQLQAVDAAFAERHRLLSNPVALCYVRVNDLPVRIDHRSTPLIPRADPGRLPVACDDAGQPPARLLPFLELLADQPMSAWRALAGDWHRLPPDWVYQPPLPALPGYAAAIPALPAAFRGLARAVPVPMVQRASTWTTAAVAGATLSQAVLGRRAADRITLEQLTAVRNVALRIAARRLQDDLSRALACLLDQLAALPAADRFAWSRLAEDDQLAVDRPAAWPGFDAHARTTAGLNLRLIVDWLHAQLAGDAPAEARAALRTTIRACLLQAVNDDPAELLQGDVVQFPGLWKPGVLLGATLNRIPTLKAPLKVYDAQRRLIGEARVVDSQAPALTAVSAVTQVQAQVEIVSTYVAAPVSFAGWTVVG